MYHRTSYFLIPSTTFMKTTETVWTGKNKKEEENAHYHTLQEGKIK